MLLLQPYKKCFVFSGRASRKEYWLFFISSPIIMFLTSIVFYMFCGDLIFQPFAIIVNSVFIYGFLYLFIGIIGLIINIAYFSVQVRRLHDINKSGWWMLLNFLPLIGIIWLAILCCFKGTNGSNIFGEEPNI